MSGCDSEPHNHMQHETSYSSTNTSETSSSQADSKEDQQEQPVMLALDAGPWQAPASLPPSLPPINAAIPPQLLLPTTRYGLSKVGMPALLKKQLAALHTLLCSNGANTTRVLCGFRCSQSEASWDRLQQGVLRYMGFCHLVTGLQQACLSLSLYLRVHTLWDYLAFLKGGGGVRLA